MNLAAHIPDIAMPDIPSGLAAGMVGGLFFLSMGFVMLFFRRIGAERRLRTNQAASLYAIREISACFQDDWPCDTEHLRQVLQAAPLDAILQFLRVYRGMHRAIVMQQAELAGVFDPLLDELSCGVASRQLAALHQLQFARGTRFRQAVRKQIMNGKTPQLRVEALRTFLLMGSQPASIVLAQWIDGTGPGLTARHEALFTLLAERYPEQLADVLNAITNPVFQSYLAAFWRKPVAASAVDATPPRAAPPQLTVVTAGVAA
jgi:hypothetical protein